MAGREEVIDKVVKHRVERARLVPIAENKLKNLFTALTGSAPPNNEAYQETLGSFQDALDQYIKYQQANPIKKALLNTVMRVMIPLKSSDYINYVDSNLAIDRNNDRISPYTKQMLDGLHQILQDKDLSNKIVRNILDYRKLEEPIPFVRSKVTDFKLLEK